MGNYWGEEGLGSSTSPLETSLSPPLSTTGTRWGPSALLVLGAEAAALLVLGAEEDQGANKR